MSRKSFKKIKLLGEGAFGFAFLVRDKADESLYVIKEQRGLQSFMITENEVSTLKKCKHPNIIAYFDSWRNPTSTFILMEYASGGNLDDFITKLGCPLTEQRSMEIISQLLLGLHHIHKKEIIHRDLKPSNIFLDGPDNRIVKIGDFGVSKDVGYKLAQTAIGTKLYMAPEVLQGKVYNNKCDLWASGIILYEMATNRYPFNFNNQDKMMEQINRGIIHIPSNLSESVKILIGKMLQKDPKNRPNTSNLITSPAIFTTINNILPFFSSEDRKIILGMK